MRLFSANMPKEAVHLEDLSYEYWVYTEDGIAKIYRNRWIGDGIFQNLTDTFSDIQRANILSDAAKVKLGLKLTGDRYRYVGRDRSDQTIRSSQVSANYVEGSSDP